MGEWGSYRMCFIVLGKLDSMILETVFVKGVSYLPFCHLSEWGSYRVCFMVCWTAWYWKQHVQRCILPPILPLLLSSDLLVPSLHSPYCQQYVLLSR